MTWLNQLNLSALHALGRDVKVHCGNGLQGYSSHAPYDKIIATGSFPSVPLAWFQQLAPGGHLLMNLKGQIGGGMLLLEKRNEHEAEGRFLESNATFMPLQDADHQPQRPKLPPRPIDPVLAMETGGELFFPNILRNQEFAFLLQWILPAGSIRRIYKQDDAFTFVLDLATDRRVQWYAERGGVSVRGSCSLWEELGQLLEEWKALGKPRRVDYTFRMERDGTQMVSIEERTWIQRGA